MTLMRMRSYGISEESLTGSWASPTSEEGNHLLPVTRSTRFMSKQNRLRKTIYQHRKRGDIRPVLVAIDIRRINFPMYSDYEFTRFSCWSERFGSSTVLLDNEQCDCFSSDIFLIFFNSKSVLGSNYWEKIKIKYLNVFASYRNLKFYIILSP